MDDLPTIMPHDIFFLLCIFLLLLCHRKISCSSRGSYVHPSTNMDLSMTLWWALVGFFFFFFLQTKILFGDTHYRGRGGQILFLWEPWELGWGYMMTHLELWAWEPWELGWGYMMTRLELWAWSKGYKEARTVLHSSWWQQWIDKQGSKQWRQWV